MEMQNNVYNIIWADDEVDTLISPKETKGLLRQKKVKIIATAHTSTEFRSAMDLFYDKVDAVITDANFNRNSTNPKSERDLSGFEDIRNCIEKYNVNRCIPFYLYTGRSEFIAERYEDGELEYFEKNNRKFAKGELPQMLDQIRKDIEHINSTSFRIRTKYAKELQAASIVEGNEEALLNALLYEYSDSKNNTEDFFNPARKIVERIFDECKKLKIVPPDLTELNAFSKFLQNKDKVFLIKDGISIMPNALAYCLEYFLNITQDGSHSRKNLDLGVDDYVRETQNINLFRSVLYIAMDLCIWFASYSKDHTDSEINSLNWEINPHNSFLYQGEILKAENGKWVCGKYQLKIDYNDDFKIGDIIGIKNATENKRVFDYTKDGETIHVDQFAYSSNLVLISRKS